MNTGSGNGESIWMTAYEVPHYGKLTGDEHAEICIIGAGITGLLTACLLALNGHDVMVIESGEQICSGETARTTGHITSVIDDRFYRIANIHGEEACRMAAESQAAAIDLIDNLVTAYKIKCDFSRVPGYLIFQPGENSDNLEKEYYAARNAGIRAEIVPAAPLEFAGKYPCLKFPDQAEFHVLKFLSAISKLIIRAGGRIFTGTHAKKITEKLSIVNIETSGGKIISAEKVIAATNSPVTDYVKIHLKQAAYRTYVIGAVVPEGYVPEGLYWDTESPYHYIRLYNDGKDEILLVGGEDHKTGQEEDPHSRYANLEMWARERFPSIKEVRYRWSGQVIEPFDGLSFIGVDPESDGRIYISTGDSGMGMTHAAYSAILLNDLLSGKENKWAELYDPKRISVKALPKFISESANTAIQYIDIITPPEAAAINEIPENSGAIMNTGLGKTAVYKSKSGKVYKFSALCTHLKCVVNWNDAEKSWDCPCHGSRFDAKGKVINGPALSDLKPIEE